MLSKLLYERFFKCFFGKKSENIKLNTIYNTAFTIAAQSLLFVNFK